MIPLLTVDALCLCELWIREAQKPLKRTEDLQCGSGGVRSNFPLRVGLLLIGLLGR